MSSIRASVSTSPPSAKLHMAHIFAPTFEKTPWISELGAAEKCDIDVGF